MSAKLKILYIDRSRPFDPATFLGIGWSTAEQDERALALTEINLAEIVLETTLKQGEKTVNGEEKLKRLKDDGRIRLDALAFQTFWENKFLIPEKWKGQTNGNITYIFFDGTVLQDSDGRRCVLYLYWDDGEWFWLYDWLDNNQEVNSSSAVLEEKKAA